MTVIQDELKGLIESELLKTKENCNFKKAWLPKGWVCVQPKRFAEELMPKISKNYSFIKK